MNFQDVPIPRRMNALQRDKRGYPVPYMVLRDSDGVPHFAINDTDRRDRCIKEKRCSICGGRLEREVWVVGGPLSAFHPDGVYLDPGLHHECATYALRVCPYLALPRYLGRVDIGGLDLTKVPDHMVFMDPTMLPDRPPVFVAVCTPGIDRVPGGEYVRPRKPYIRVEFWQNGYQIPGADGVQIVKSAVDNYRKNQLALNTPFLVA